MKRHERVTFRPYEQHQMMLMPPSLEDLVPRTHLVRVVNDVVDAMDLAQLFACYRGGGTSSYHPRMMLKVLVYAYTQRLFTSRQIAKALRENVHFMWLSGQQRPDFRTVNRFRGEILGQAIEPVFAALLELMLRKGYIRFEDYFLDGTKHEANAGRYSFVWRKSVKRYKAAVQKKAQQLLREADEANAAEDNKYGDHDLPEVEGEPISAEELESKIGEIEERLAGRPKDRQHRRARTAARQLRKECLVRLRRYEGQEQHFGGRNSYAKTDPAATFMRMKDTTVAGAPLKPAYNIQIGTENQFVLGYSVHQRAGDPGCLIPHLQECLARSGRLPERVIADAGYGSEENYAYLAEHGIGNYVKYNTFDREQRPRCKPKIYRSESWPYHAEQDHYLCPAGRRLFYRYTSHQKTENGYATERRVYECEDCEGCSRRAQCTRSKGNRQMRISRRLRAWQNQASDNLTTAQGKILRARRNYEPETVFGLIKQNWGHRRFVLRGLSKVKLEWGMLCIAHNLAHLRALGA